MAESQQLPQLSDVKNTCGRRLHPSRVKYQAEATPLLASGILRDEAEAFRGTKSLSRRVKLEIVSHYRLYTGTRWLS